MYFGHYELYLPYLNGETFVMNQQDTDDHRDSEDKNLTHLVIPLNSLVKLRY